MRMPAGFFVTGTLAVTRVHKAADFFMRRRNVLFTASNVFAATRFPVSARMPYTPYIRSVVFLQGVSLMAALLGTRTLLSAAA
mmetsp:Transcript_8689/g.15016  ORF Transcript_8689/g.15016 Transcript_8689/m.15016 type:complete len:83 (-) Transcript_8689:318-566(-)